MWSRLGSPLSSFLSILGFSLRDTFWLLTQLHELLPVSPVESMSFELHSYGWETPALKSL